ncbi:transporter substrate-binding domain-containing protein [Arthrobacter sp. FW306-04-A]|uniref:glutamate ABC transporter substrate-binding protein n=1 Tax=Arthrobacter sp. FW306-04-A TaxID=2879619 RepID=UPI0037C17A53|nr:glutamate ABC transporter substrate-binding protein [Arthrobacter sp. FW306-04-A]
MMAIFARTRLRVAGICVASALALSACGSTGPATGTAPASPAPTAITVAKDVALTGSPTFDKIRSTGKVRIGVKQDQPGLGFKDSTTGEYSGFDIQIATWIAASLGYDKDKIEFTPILSGTRESAITTGAIDYYVGSYPITDHRKKVIDFAGPYLVTGQGLMVRKDNASIGSEKDLAGKNVCSATGVDSIKYIQANFPAAQTTELDTYAKCVESLKAGQVDAVTTDQAVLMGYTAQDPDHLKVVGQPFTTEKYGVGIPKGDKALRTFIGNMLTDGGAIWKKIYKDTLGKSGTTSEQPKVDQY